MDVLVTVTVLDGELGDESASVSGECETTVDLMDMVLELATDCAMQVGAVPA